MRKSGIFREKIWKHSVSNYEPMSRLSRLVGSNVEMDHASRGDRTADAGIFSPSFMV